MLESFEGQMPEQMPQPHHTVETVAAVSPPSPEQVAAERLKTIIGDTNPITRVDALLAPGEQGGILARQEGKLRDSMDTLVQGREGLAKRWELEQERAKLWKNLPGTEEDKDLTYAEVSRRENALHTYEQTAQRARERGNERTARENEKKAQMERQSLEGKANKPYRRLHEIDTAIQKLVLPAHSSPVDEQAATALEISYQQMRETDAQLGGTRRLLEYYKHECLAKEPQLNQELVTVQADIQASQRVQDVVQRQKSPITNWMTRRFLGSATADALTMLKKGASMIEHKLKLVKNPADLADIQQGTSAQEALQIPGCPRELSVAIRMLTDSALTNDALTEFAQQENARIFLPIAAVTIGPEAIPKLQTNSAIQKAIFGDHPPAFSPQVIEEKPFIHPYG